MALVGGKNIYSRNLSFHIEFKSEESYSGSGNEVKSIGRGSGKTAKIKNNVQYNSSGFMVFDGSSYIALEDYVYEGPIEEMSVELVFKTQQLTVGHIISFDSALYWSIYSEYGILKVKYLTDAGIVTLSSQSGVNNNELHSVVFTFKKGEGNLYLNGFLEDSNRTGSQIGANDSQARYGMIGVESNALTPDGTINPDSYFQGSVQSVKIYDEELSIKKVKRNVRSFDHKKYYEKYKFVKEELKKVQSERSFNIISTALLPKSLKLEVFKEDVKPSLPADATDYFSNVTEIPDLELYDISEVTNMTRLFFNKPEFDQDLETWDVSNVTNMSEMFSGASEFEGDIDNWNVSSVTDMSNMFYGAEEFDSYIARWNVANVTTMKNMFAFATDFNKDLDSWNVSSVTDMSGMFNGARSFRKSLNSWNVSSVTDMSSMFKDALYFTGYIYRWNVSSVTDMSNMFNGARYFNQYLGFWNVGSVTNMNHMFANAWYFNQSLSAWNVSNVTDMSYMFNNSKNFNGYIGNWNVGNVTNMAGMFEGASRFNVNLSNWNISNVTDMTNMFKDSGMTSSTYSATLTGWAARNTLQPNVTLGATGIKYTEESATSRAILTGTYGWTIIDGGVDAIAVQKDQSPYVSYYSYTYGYGADGIGIGIDNLEDFEVYSNVTESLKDTSYYSVYGRYGQYGVGQPGDVIGGDVIGGVGLINLDSLIITIDNLKQVIADNRSTFNEELNWLDVSSLTDMSDLFYKASVFNQSLDKWNTSNVVNMNAMFNLATQFNQDISVWDVSNVTDMSQMFASATSFNQSINDWDVSNVTDMYAMFAKAKTFNQPLNNWNISNVIRLSAMFSGAESFNQDISSWDTSSVMGMSSMFQNAYSFNQDISSWDISGINSISNLFRNAYSFDQNLSNWNIGKIGSAFDAFYMCGISTTNYSNTLIGWAAQAPNIQSNVSIYFSQYHNQDAISAINTLTAEYGWTITDEGLMPNADSLTRADLLIPNPSELDVSQLTDFTIVFKYTGLLTEYRAYFNKDISNWNVSNATTMIGMFQDARAFNQDLSNWDVSGVMYMTNMFNGSGMSTTNYSKTLRGWGFKSFSKSPQSNVRLDALNIKYGGIATEYRNRLTSVFGWTIIDGGEYTKTDIKNKIIAGEDVTGEDTGSLIDLSGILKSNAGASTFNQDISSWDVSEVNDMRSLFYIAKIFNQDISNWNVSKLTYASELFYGAEAFNQDISNWNVHNVIDMRSMFENAKTFNQNISQWSTSKVDTMIRVFRIAYSFDQNLSNWNIGKVTNMNNMFDFSGMSAENYSSTLIGWAAQAPNIQSNVALGASTIKYNQNAESARNVLTATYGWTITDGGLQS